ncbi:hypothetical protein [Streptomyces sp. b94]|uniref:hypothetical protein n=1 Tax=Streptomyces sp. b94 TaxID=1827634 RepID=UPI001FFC985D|nr:hypothetical protein [Streptomyces sp. b94]
MSTERVHACAPIFPHALMPPATGGSFQLRPEIRRLKTAAFAHLDHPHARQALQVVRWRRDLGMGKLTIERIYLVTSLPPGAATGTELAAWIRGHWRAALRRTARDHLRPLTALGLT